MGIAAKILFYIITHPEKPGTKIAFQLVQKFLLANRQFLQDNQIYDGSARYSKMANVQITKIVQIYASNFSANPILILAQLLNCSQIVTK